VPELGPPVTPAVAATVVVLRPSAHGPEVLLTHRPPTMAFAADMHVFPGGRVDAADGSDGLAARSSVDRTAAAERLGGELPPPVALAAHIAAIRELWEEAGILLADTPGQVEAVTAARAGLLAGPMGFEDVAVELDLRLRTDMLRPLSRWVTPPGYPRRFDARFFAAVAPPQALASIGGDEVTAIEWHRPADALDAMADGRLGMWLPTSGTLQQLEHVRALDELEHLVPGLLGAIEVDAPADDVVRVVMPSGGGVAGQPVCAYLVGRRRTVLVDPGDPTGPALEQCVSEAAARGATIEAIVLTHVDPDHHGGAEALAERLGIPVLAGPGAGRRLPYRVTELVDGEVLSQADVRLEVLVTPGPRPDHVALVVGDRAAVVTGDLDGRRGVRSVLAPADESAWAGSRERIDALGTGIVRLPGHPPARQIGA
jgi:glyoxylase-like metal-dependent hydrolase (beta-lactamase superfamily II)/8-oxo-dGTP pyrophosphatase MutT (NUDIX family)